MTLDDAIAQCPIIAILRGIWPDNVLEIAYVLYQAGIRIVEVPLNSPLPLISIARLTENYGERMLVGAGTVLRPAEASAVHRAGAKLIVSPNCNELVIRRTRSLGLDSLPGVATPTEAFSALAAGASALKLFPAEAISPEVLKAWRAVLPDGTAMIPVGGVGIGNIAAYLGAGARGVGVGSSLFKPEMDVHTVSANAAMMVAACR